MGTFKLEWNYSDYLSANDLYDNQINQDRWAEVLDLLESRHIERLDEEILWSIRDAHNELYNKEEVETSPCCDARIIRECCADCLEHCI